MLKILFFFFYFPLNADLTENPIEEDVDNELHLKSFPVWHLQCLYVGTDITNKK